MSQLSGSGPRRAKGGSMDVFTALALAGTFALGIALTIMYVAAKELAGGGSHMPWEFLN